MARSVSPARLLLLTFLAFPVSPAAQEPQSTSPTTRLIPFTSILPDAGRDAGAGARTITFALYDEAEDGTRLWSETQVVSVDARGRYSAHLGASTPLPLDIFRTEQARWLEVTVDGAALPRTMLVAVPYALRAVEAETLGGTPASDFLRTDANGRRLRPDGTAVDDPLVDGTGVPNQIAKWSTPTTLSSSIVSESFDNRLGILAPDPTGGGVVDSRVTIRNPDNNTAFGVLSPFNQCRFALNTRADGSWTLFDGLNGTWNQGLTQRDGRVGIGSLNPDGILYVRTSAANVAAVVGVSTFDNGVEGRSDSGAGVVGFSGSGEAAIWGLSSGSALAGRFYGHVHVEGTLTKLSGSFRIDHPLDPANKYLSHSFVESPDMMNVYNGNVTLDANGEAWVTLPDWFEALNRDVRYQLTAVGAPGPNLYIAAKVSGNRFKIGGGAPGGEVSWLVTGIRQDAWANAHRIAVEEDKPEHERGFYLYPEVFGLPATLKLPSRRPSWEARR